jgi:hypothetical protein
MYGPSDLPTKITELYVIMKILSSFADFNLNFTTISYLSLSLLTDLTCGSMNHLRGKHDPPLG